MQTPWYIIRVTKNTSIAMPSLSVVQYF